MAAPVTFLSIVDPILNQTFAAATKNELKLNFATILKCQQSSVKTEQRIGHILAEIQRSGPLKSH